MITEPELTDDDMATLGVGDYLAMFGCDPCYDREPRKKGDGYIFYNYSVEKNDVSYLQNQLLPALYRQLEDDNLTLEDIENFKAIVVFVKRTIAEISI